MKYLSLFSGIEAVTVAAQNYNFEPVAFSEIADFPNAVLKYHYPHVPNLGDVKNINGAKYNGTIDLIVGGSPCQDFSISGNRAGLHGERSGLAREYIRVLSEIKPKWFLWENVPGALSTNRGQDFKRLLTEISKLGYGVAWRILDAQYFGVPQRRRRIFLVGYFGDWRPPAAVLFEQKSLSGNFKKSKRKQESSSRNIETSSFPTMLNNICPTILASSGTKQFLGNQESFSGKFFVFDHMHSKSIRTYEDISPTLLSRMGTGGNQVQLTFTAQSFAKFIHNNVGSTLKFTGGTYDGGSENLAIYNTFVRKLTPLECERLQGFPDNYTDIPYKGKYHSPLSKRYEAIGNSMAVPVVEWILKRIDFINKKKEEQ